MQGIQGLLGWDEMVMLPPGAGASEARAAQKSALAGFVHEAATSESLGKLISKLSARIEEEGSGSGDGGSFDEWALANVREASRDFTRASAVPRELAQKKASLESTAYAAWLSARSKSDFSVFAPALSEWIELCKQIAKAIDPGAPTYDVLLDEFEVGATEQRVLEVFECVKAGVIPLRREILEKGKKISSTPSFGGGRTSFDPEVQARLCREVALDLGFDLDKGRLDVSVHPFTGGTCPADVRMTTRFKAEDLLEGVTATTHETGHALYEQQRPSHVAGLPVSSARSLGTHESQSLFWERHIGLTKPFASYLAKKINEHFPPTAEEEGGRGEPTAEPEALYVALNAVKDPSLVRVEADELSYPLHVVLRVEIEAALLKGEMKVEEVPKVWDEKMRASFDCVPPSDDGRVNCLQDMHWAGGAIGYFPTYVLGAIAAAQLDETARRELSSKGLDFDAEVASGKEGFAKLREWLREKVHSRGSLPESLDALMVEATGRPLDVGPYLGHLASKYGPLYDLPPGRAEDLVATGLKLAEEALERARKR